MASEGRNEALVRRIEVVPLRRGWWVTRMAAGPARLPSHWGRMIGRRAAEGLMLGARGA